MQTSFILNNTKLDRSLNLPHIFPLIIYRIQCLSIKLNIMASMYIHWSLACFCNFSSINHISIMNESINVNTLLHSMFLC